MKLRPLHDRVLVKVLPANTKTAGGILIPETVAEKPQEGEVVAVGHGKLMQDGSIRPISLEVGELVLFSKYSGVQAKSEEENLLLLREDDILAVIEQNDK